MNKYVEAEQVSVDSPDITAAIVRFSDRVVLVASVYVPGGDARAMKEACENIHEAVAKVRGGTGMAVDVVLVGDFNRHDQLWGGDDVSSERQGEADPIIDLMLLNRGVGRLDVVHQDFEMLCSSGGRWISCCALVV